MNANQPDNKDSFDWIPTSITDVWNDGFHALQTVEVTIKAPTKTKALAATRRRTVKSR
ncbi:hypothetical protein [Alcanivorax sp. 1008]|uniref:hypothetical protein n=1 Tax=Alcanivorax sp. 1008 TaxID=2816853 RepID=UPI001DC5B90A|nr:hypothetical protein [Alcanivorax sp. 1008]MCC1496817.1 hypothetical protein [Alcanivorax sp. 1008]